jgi:hypothetical protein
MTAPDWYAVLGVGRTASRAQIARAFRKLAFRWHPDRNAGNPELAHRQFLLVQRAYEVLGDPESRRDYDARSAPEGAAKPAPPPRAAGPAGSRGPHPALAILSRAAWLPLAALIKTASFLLLLVLGPLAERLARTELNRRAPALVDTFFPIGRLALLAGIALVVVEKSWRPVASPRFAIVLLLAGALIFVIERIALASVWAFGGGRRPKS